MRRIAVINQKGGVGKTTTTANLGAALAAAATTSPGHPRENANSTTTDPAAAHGPTSTVDDPRILLVDLDPQAHLTMHFGAEVEEGRPSVYDVMVDSRPIADTMIEVRPNVTLVPAHTDLAGAELELVSVVGREVILRDAIDAVDNAASDGQGAFDVLLIDCPPSLSLLTINALAAAQEVIIPLQAHFLALQGLGKLIETMTLVRRRINPQLRIAGIVLCMFDAGTRLAAEVVEDVTNFLNSVRGGDGVCADARLYNTRIRRNIKLAESPSFGQTVFDYAPNSNGAIDYTTLAAEVLLQGDWPQDDPAAESESRLAPQEEAPAHLVTEASHGESPAWEAHG
ncbi:MAG: ParA family protein [Phycisphaerales bacterium]|nr:MAG: ParA family protein [Phycisphaerales bacterium]